MKTPEETTETAEICDLSSNLVRGVLLLQEKWVLLIVHRLLNGPLGFNELTRQADGVNSTTLSQRLALLEHAGLVTKTIHSTMPPRTSYELTEAGRALKPVLEAIETWSGNYLAGRDLTSRCKEAVSTDEH
ncbi:MAG TPA: helix-turn-helix domain-containing protein [Chthonomonadaceae bacterium]|nr:helix-turn-helix domain-containing protein [Chthonomonadaceae bacterium]